MSDGPLIVQSDKTLLLEVDHERAGECRKAIAPFAELERAPEHVHTYRVTPLALWNARAAGHDAEQVVDALISFSRYPVPHALLVDIAETMARYGRLKLENSDHHGLTLTSTDKAVLEEVLRSKKIQPMLGRRIGDDSVAVHPSERGNIKQALLKLGWPAEDLAGYVDGEHHPITLDQDTWTLRPYQREAADSFWHGGSGVVVLPCGAGKTLVGAAAMAHAQATTLILVTNTVSAHQWKQELLKRTSLTEEEIGEYTGTKKEIRPVTIATYQVMTTRRQGVYRHLELFDARDWGLVVYDEVHLLPAPIFRMTADLQARRRIGLTATLVREDGREGDVFSLIGPKRYDAPWKEMENQGWIAPADCVEVRVTLSDEERLAYAMAESEERYRFCATTPSKTRVTETLVRRHAGEQVLVIGQYIDQLDELADHLNAPVIKGETRVKERERLFQAFRDKEIQVLVVSKVANFSIDLPEASVAIQVSGTFGSRQEEAQRLGRVLRPKSDGGGARFYSVVSRDTVDQDFAAHRQRFLAEQGYAYQIIDADDVLAGE
ncbi:putative DNA helicase [Sphaerisporangium krabiense]|uniref:DNA 3'-5' helicase n=1 Tax=Sphaerisporangium krabiense TaxID=763782 RepID=A0A7W8Z426_9ACTN|nr:DNA repair helicase XPB [Sphaerisporangium krabiense]MBB5627026.1 DNA excision repair protein ERCC-3 [Sphaerisporangium krabiense]GII65180.1 putative DNA helicase [Sphaerisporangium krabiense]